MHCRAQKVRAICRANGTLLTSRRRSDLKARLAQLEELIAKQEKEAQKEQAAQAAGGHPGSEDWTFNERGEVSRSSAREHPSRSTDANTTPIRNSAQRSSTRKVSPCSTSARSCRPSPWLSQ